MGLIVGIAMGICMGILLTCLFFLSRRDGIKLTRLTVAMALSFYLPTIFLIYYKLEYSEWHTGVKTYLGCASLTMIIGMIGMIAEYPIYYLSAKGKLKKEGIKHTLSWLKLRHHGFDAFDKEYSELISDRKKDKIDADLVVIPFDNLFEPKHVQELKEKSTPQSFIKIGEFIAHQEELFLKNLEKLKALEKLEDNYDYSQIFSILYDFTIKYFDLSTASFTLRKYNEEYDLMETFRSTRIPDPGNIPWSSKNLIRKSMQENCTPQLYSENVEWHYQTKKPLSTWCYVDYICMCLYSANEKPMYSLCFDVTDVNEVEKLKELRDSGAFMQLGIAIKKMIIKVILTKEKNDNSSKNTKLLKRIKND